jgi:hypothetical protein
MCFSKMMFLHNLDNSRGGYFNVPIDPQDTKRFGVAKEAARKKRVLRNRTLVHMGRLQGFKQAGGSAGFYVAFLHYHPQVLAAIKGSKQLTSKVVPLHVKSEVQSSGSQYTAPDMIEQGRPSSGYFAVPNYTTEQIRAEISRRAPAALTPPPTASGVPSISPEISSPAPVADRAPRAGAEREQPPNTPHASQKQQQVIPRRAAPSERTERAAIQSNSAAAATLNTQLREQNEALVAQLAARDSRIAQLEKAASASSAAAVSAAALELELAVGGLTRASLTSPDWHRLHPTAANHLFGFPGDFAVAVAYIWALFEVSPSANLKRKSRRKENMTDFEKCLITKMHFRRRCSSYQSLV